MATHRTFNADRFLDTFQGREPLLRNCVGMWAGRLEVDGAMLDVARFKDFLVNGDGDGKNELLETLYRAYDLCTERGHEDLVAACRDFRYDPDPEGALPVEWLSLKVRVEHEDAFNLAYDRNTVWLAELVEHGHQTINGEVVKLHVANAGKVRMADTGAALGLARRKPFAVKNANDTGGQKRLGLLHVGVRAAEVTEDIAAAVYQPTIVGCLAHGCKSLVNRLSRSRVRSISFFGVSMSCFAFFRKV